MTRFEAVEILDRHQWLPRRGNVTGSAVLVAEMVDLTKPLKKREY
jgi:hypothetical protein